MFLLLFAIAWVTNDMTPIFTVSFNQRKRNNRKRLLAHNRFRLKQQLWANNTIKKICHFWHQMILQIMSHSLANIIQIPKCGMRRKYMYNFFFNKWIASCDYHYDDGGKKKKMQIICLTGNFCRKSDFSRWINLNDICRFNLPNILLVSKLCSTFSRFPNSFSEMIFGNVVDHICLFNSATVADTFFFFWHISSGRNKWKREKTTTVNKCPNRVPSHRAME